MDFHNCSEPFTVFGSFYLKSIGINLYELKEEG